MHFDYVQPFRRGHNTECAGPWMSWISHWGPKSRRWGYLKRNAPKNCNLFSIFFQRKLTMDWGLHLSLPSLTHLIEAKVREWIIPRTKEQ